MPDCFEYLWSKTGTKKGWIFVRFDEQSEMYLLKRPYLVSWGTGFSVSREMLEDAGEGHLLPKIKYMSNLTDADSWELCDGIEWSWWKRWVNRLTKGRKRKKAVDNYSKKVYRVRWSKGSLAKWLK